jgi:hypothetical protein
MIEDHFFRLTFCLECFRIVFECFCELEVSFRYLRVFLRVGWCIDGRGWFSFRIRWFGDWGFWFVFLGIGFMIISFFIEVFVIFLVIGFDDGVIVFIWEDVIFMMIFEWN